MFSTVDDGDGDDDDENAADEDDVNDDDVCILTCVCPSSSLLQSMQGSECLFEAVEQQDLDAVQILLYQYTAEELDLNTPNSQGLTPLDVAIMTNNTPIAKLLLKAGGKESPHCEYTLRRAHCVHTK